MPPLIRRALFAAFAFAVLASPAYAVTYTATLLHPDDLTESSAAGVSNATQVGNGYSPDFSGGPHAMKWSGSAASIVDLNPNNFTSTYATAATDTKQVGYGIGPATDDNIHALLWSDTAGSVVDLNPTGIDVSYAHDVDGVKQVGYGFNAALLSSHALLWSGSAASKVDLHPSGFTETFANGVSGVKQVGYGYGTVTDDNNHALLWTGTSSSFVDLNPTNFSESYANDVYTNGATTTQVGSGSGAATAFATHALLWTGTAASKVDLHPAGFDFSEALGISAAGQVGDGFSSSTNNNYHAFYWNGTAASAIDLHPSLSALGYEFLSSTATSIAANGTIVGTATDDGLHSYAVLWTPQPDVPTESGVAGDYNNDGKVDAGDYVAWRKGNTTLRNEVATLGSNTPDDYTAWRARFGDNASSGLSNAPIPEPTTYILALVALVIAAASPQRRRTSQV